MGFMYVATSPGTWVIMLRKPAYGALLLNYAIQMEAMP